MKEVWASKCDDFRYVLFMNNDTTGLNEIDHVLQPPNLLNDTYGKLTDKVLNAIKYVYFKYPNFDWYLKADDDTYVFVDNLRWFLSKKNASKPVTFG